VLTKTANGRPDATYTAWRENILLNIKKQRTMKYEKMFSYIPKKGSLMHVLSALENKSKPFFDFSLIPNSRKKLMVH
jgi:hypothetical protein